MRNLLNFIWRNQFVILFLCFQSICFLLLFQYNSFHKAHVLNLTAEVSGSTFSMLNNTTEYLKLKEVNEQLLKENGFYKSRNKVDGYYSLTPHVKYFNDSIHHKQYNYIGAKIINNTVSKRNNYITINRGSADGIKPEMGLITKNGIIGVIKDVSEHFAVALSVLHGKTTVGVKLKNDDYFGLMSWDGKNYQNTQLSDIPNHVNVQIGDTAVSRGHSTLYPANIPVGIITGINQEEGEIFYSIEMKLLEDLKQTSYCYAVENIIAIEQIELEEKVEDEI